MSNNLVTQAEELQKEAIAVFSNPNIRDFLSKFGTCELVGSAKYGLMTWRDIDIELITTKVPSDDNFWKIVKHFFDLAEVEYLTLSDNRNQKEKKRPKSMYVGLRYTDDNNELWKIDIRILKSEDITSNETVKMLSDLTEEQKIAILRIKSQTHNNPEYHKKISSVDIYRAVVEGWIRNIESFWDWI